MAHVARKKGGKQGRPSFVTQVVKVTNPRAAEPGQPPTIDQPIVEFICAQLRLSLSLQDASALAGLGRETAVDWLNKGLPNLDAVRSQAALQNTTFNEGSLNDYGKFALSVERAHADARKLLTGIVLSDRQSPDSRARHGAWVLERRHTKEYGPPSSRVELSGPEGEPIAVSVDASERAILEAALSIQAKHAAKAKKPTPPPDHDAQ